MEHFRAKRGWGRPRGCSTPKKPTTYMASKPSIRSTPRSEQALGRPRFIEVQVGELYTRVHKTRIKISFANPISTFRCHYQSNPV